MHDPRVPHPEHDYDKLQHQDADQQEHPGRPEVIQEEIVRSSREPRDPEVVSEDIVRSTRLHEESNPAREETLHPGAQEQPAARTSTWPRIASLLVIVALAVVEIFLAARLILLMTTWVPPTGFASFIYGSTNWMVSPFRGLVPNISTGAGPIESATPVAMIAYLIPALILFAVLRALASRPDTRRPYAGPSERRPRAL